MRPGIGWSLALLTLVACSATTSPAPTPSSPAATEAGASPTAAAVETERPSASPSASVPAELSFTMEAFPVPAGSHPHDVAPAADGGVWYTGQRSGELGWLDPESGEVRRIPLGATSRPHGVVVGPDEAAWVTDGGLNAIVRVDEETDEVTTYQLPPGPNANLNTATFDGDGTLWFTGQEGIYGSLDPVSGELAVYDAPGEQGPYGIATTPAGEVYFGSLAGSYLAAVDTSSGEATEIATPTAGGGARRVWSDSDGRLWITEWFAGNLAMYDPATEVWTEWRLPGDQPMPYAVYVDETDAVWVTDFGANALLRFDPATEEFTSFPHTSSPAEVRQLLGRPGEVWGPESAADQLIVVRYGR